MMAVDNQGKILKLDAMNIKYVASSGKELIVSMKSGETFHIPGSFISFTRCMQEEREGYFKY